MTDGCCLSFSSLVLFFLVIGCLTDFESYEYIVLVFKVKIKPWEFSNRDT